MFVYFIIVGSDVNKYIYIYTHTHIYIVTQRDGFRKVDSKSSAYQIFQYALLFVYFIIVGSDVNIYIYIYIHLYCNFTFLCVWKKFMLPLSA